MYIINEWDDQYYLAHQDDFGEIILRDYWCPKCKTWELFQFENWGMCDNCAMDRVDFSVTKEQVEAITKGWNP